MEDCQHLCCKARLPSPPRHPTVLSRSCSKKPKIAPALESFERRLRQPSPPQSITKPLSLPPPTLPQRRPQHTPAPMTSANPSRLTLVTAPARPMDRRSRAVTKQLVLFEGGPYHSQPIDDRCPMLANYGTHCIYRRYCYCHANEYKREALMQSVYPSQNALCKIKTPRVPKTPTKCSSPSSLTSIQPNLPCKSPNSRHR